MTNSTKHTHEADVDRLIREGNLHSLARLRKALTEGGSATVTVRSAKTGKHVTVRLVARLRGTDGKWVSRATKAGRVGIFDATCVEARDPALEGPDAYIGRFYLDNGKWSARADIAPSRAWTAERVIEAARTGIELAHEMFVADDCSVCGRELTDPESLTRGMGPECFGQVTGSKAA